MSRRMSIYKWIKAIEELKSKGIKIVHRSALEALYPHKEQSFNVIISRLSKLSVIKKITKNWYAIAPYEIWEALPMIYPSAYLSLEWALSYYEIIDQKIYKITAVWLGKTKTTTIGNTIIELHKIKKELYFGYDTKHIAYPEKALLDLAYLKKRLPKELNLELLDKQRLFRYMKKYPKTTKKLIIRITGSMGSK